MLRFFHAAVLAGLITTPDGSPDAPAIDLPKARNILMGLAREYPQNSTYPLYLIEVEAQLGLSPAQLKPRLEQMVQGDYLWHHEKDVYQCFMLALEKKPYLFEPIVSILSIAQVTKWTSPLRRLRELMSAYPELTDEVRNFSDRLRTGSERNLEFQYALHSFDMAHHFAQYFDWIAARLEKKDPEQMPKISEPPNWQKTLVHKLSIQAFPKPGECVPGAAASWLRAVQESIQAWRQDNQLY